MSALAGSLIANAVLAALVLAIFLRAKSRIIEEKMATFAGALNVMTYGLAAADAGQRWNRLAFALKGMLGDADEEEIRWRLIRASMMRFLRSQPVAADLGEHLHALTLECMRGDSEAERVWAYIDAALAQEPGFEEEPSTHFEAKELANGQLQLEADLFRMYRAALNSRPHRLFAG